jgi:predicted P-loop ATPase
MTDKIDFAALAAALLPLADTLVPQWLPGGTRRGHEYQCADLSGGAGSSCSVNLTNGRWADFAADERGNDLVSLYAAVHGLEAGPAAVTLAHEHGLERVANVKAPRPGNAPPPAPRPPPPAAPAKPKADEGWQVVAPVPDHAPQPTFHHFQRKPQDIEHTATYQCDGALYGYVVRFLTSDGGKDPIPHTWCTSARDGASRWHWKTWEEPRPLYLPGGTSPGGRTVVLVEGEKKADVLQRLLDATTPGVYCVASWPGGSKAWRKADWSWLAGCTVLAWPDCDAKRVPLTREQKASCPDEAARLVLQAAQPLLPEAKQPGMAAMLGIGALLRDAQGCQVQLLPIPAPGAVADGWDCADAINADGWTGEQVLAFFGRAQPLPRGDADGPAPAAAGGGKPPKTPPRDGPADAGDGDEPPDDGEDAFEAHLRWMEESMKVKRHEIGVTRKLLITMLRKAPDLQGVLGLDELRNAPCTQRPWPWRPEAGPLTDTDDLRLGDWGTHKYHLKAASRAALSEAIDTVADENRFHPIRDWLEAQAWDGTPRLEKWLMHALGVDVSTVKPKRRRYLEMVGRYWLLGMVARVMEPGCKFDYSLVLEGPPGRGKSTFFKTLAGKAFFSDTHFDIGQGKDGYEQLEGLWVYELSELTALRKADSEQVKQFFSSQVDRFRGAYGRFVQPHPRQCVIGCSTNKRQYLYDLTGNRRFWPVWVDARIRVSWLAKWRGQLFAEALAVWREGAEVSPTPEEEAEFFEPEQRKRLVETAVQSRLLFLLSREGASAGDGRVSAEFNVNSTFVTLDALVAALGADAAKSTAILEQQIRGWLESNGWARGREGGGARRWGWRQPKAWPPEVREEDEDDRPPEGAPSGTGAGGTGGAVDDAGERQPGNDGEADDLPI